jgi:hypothetical protein
MQVEKTQGFGALRRRDRLVAIGVAATWMILLIVGAAPPAGDSLSIPQWSMLVGGLCLPLVLAIGIVKTIADPYSASTRVKYLFVSAIAWTTWGSAYAYWLIGHVYHAFANSGTVAEIDKVDAVGIAIGNLITRAYGWSRAIQRYGERADSAPADSHLCLVCRRPGFRECTLDAGKCTFSKVRSGSVSCAAPFSRTAPSWPPAATTAPCTSGISEAPKPRSPCPPPTSSAATSTRSRSARTAAPRRWEHRPDGPALGHQRPADPDPSWCAQSAGYYVYSSVFSPDGTMLAVSLANSTIQLYNVTDPAHPTPIGAPPTGPQNYVYSLSFTTDGTNLAASTSDSTIWIWDLQHRDAPTLYATLTLATRRHVPRAIPAPQPPSRRRRRREESVDLDHRYRHSRNRNLQHQRRHDYARGVGSPHTRNRISTALPDRITRPDQSAAGDCDRVDRHPRMLLRSPQ